MKKVTAFGLSAVTLLFGIFIGWTLKGVARYDACLDRINYEKALWHLCDSKEPRAPGG